MNEQLPVQIQQQLDGGFRSPDARHAFESELSYGRHNGPAPRHALRAAVMLLLYPGPRDWQLPLTLRPAHLTSHAGQISLPGGAAEGSEDSSQTALRELDEELGVPPDDVRLLGRLTDLYIFGSNYLVTPWVGVVPSPPEWRPQASEVAQVLDVSLQHLADESSRSVSLRTHRAVRFLSPHITCEDHEVWGATSMILGEFVALLRAVEYQTS